MSYLTRHKQMQSNKDDAKSSISTYSNAKSVKSGSIASNPQKKEQVKEDILEKMKQNDDKHKQLMLDNQRRRKEQERKLKQQDEERRNKEQKLLGQRKQDKEEAYIKYLRQNSKNVLENLKGNQQAQQAQTQYPKQTQKPPVATKQQAQTYYPERDKNTFAALDVETYQKKQAPSSGNMFRQEFEKSWAQEEEFDVMRKSELLDSLDLETKPSRKRPPTQQRRIEELIGYEDVASEDEDDYWNFTLKEGKKENLKPLKDIAEEVSKIPMNIDGIDNALKPQITKQLEPKPIVSRPNASVERRQENIEKPQQSSDKTQTIMEKPKKVDKVITNIKPTLNVPQSEKPIVNTKAAQNVVPPRRTSQPKKPPNANATKAQRKFSPNTIATREGDIDIQQFLKVDHIQIQQEDMMHINHEELRVQMEIVNLNSQTNQKIQDHNQKFGIRTNLVSSQQIRNPQAKVTAATEENQIEESLLRIENLLNQKQQQQQPFVRQIAQPQPPLVNQQFQMGAQMALQQYQQQTQIPTQTFGIPQPPQYQQQSQNGVQFPPFPQYVLHQDHQSFYNEASSNAQGQGKQNIYNTHYEQRVIPKQPLQGQDQYNFQLDPQAKPNFEVTQGTAEQIAQMLMQNPQLLEKLGFQPKPQPEEIQEEIQVEDEQQSTFSDGRTFKITKRKGPQSVRSQQDTSMMSTFSKASEKPSGYAQSAANKKNSKKTQHQEQIIEDEEEEPSVVEGKIKFAGNAQLLFD